MKIFKCFFALFLAYCTGLAPQNVWADSIGIPISVQSQVIDESCPNSGDGSISLTISGGTSPYTILWSTGDAIPTLLGLTNGIYSVQITDSLGCTYLDTFQIGFQTSFPFVNAGNNQSVCGPQYQLNGNNPSPGTGSWQVLSGSGTFVNATDPQTVVNGLSLGLNQFVWVVTEGNCSRADTVIIVSDSLPTASAGADTLVCDNSITVNASPPGLTESGVWFTSDPGLIINNPGSSQALVLNLAPGPNTLVWTLSTGACSDSDTVVVFLQPPPVANFSETISILTVQFTDLSSDAINWLWDFGDAQNSNAFSPTHVYSSPGTYQVCLTTTNQCGNDSICKILEVTCPPSQVGFQVTDTLLTVSLTNTSQPGFSNPTYLWHFGDGNSSTAVDPIHVYAQPGTYQLCLTLTDSCGSKDFCDSVTVNCPRGVAAFNYTVVPFGFDFFNGSNSVDPGVSYFWDFGDGDTSTQVNPTHNYGFFGTYQVCLTLIDACGRDTICQTVTYEPLVGVSSGLEMQLKLWPQPATDGVEVSLTSDSEGMVPISLWNSQGKVLWKGELEMTAGTGQCRIDLSQFPQGIYWLRIQDERPIMRSVLKQ